MTARRVIVSAYASDDEARILTYVLGLRGVTAAKALLERFERGIEARSGVQCRPPSSSSRSL